MKGLRGHHLICLHFFSGEGYNPAFIENLRDILRIAENQEIEILHGADDICEKCPYLKHGRCEYNEHADDKIREMDDMALRLLNTILGMKIKWQEIKEMLPGIFYKWYRSFCGGCDWKGVCEKDSLYQKLKAKMIKIRN